MSKIDHISALAISSRVMELTGPDKSSLQVYLSMVALQGPQNCKVEALQSPKCAQKGLFLEFFAEPSAPRPILPLYCTFCPLFSKVVALQRPKIENWKMVIPPLGVTRQSCTLNVIRRTFEPSCSHVSLSILACTVNELILYHMQLLLWHHHS